MTISKALQKIAVSLIVLFTLLAVSASPTFANEPWWHLSSASRPSYLQPGHQGEISVTAVDLGDASVDPATQPVKIVDRLPEGLEAVAIEGAAGEGGVIGQENSNQLACSNSSTEGTCTYTGAGRLQSLPPFRQLLVRIWVKVKPEAKNHGEVNVASVTGGGATPVSSRQSLVVSAGPTPFAVNTYEMRPEEEGGGIDMQAGSHPFQFTTTLAFNEIPSTREPSTEEAELHPGIGHFLGKPVAMAKDLHFKLPVGLIGNPTVFPRCTLAQFLAPGVPDFSDQCPPQSALGVARVTLAVPGYFGGAMAYFTLPLFNLEPAVGEPARFGFYAYNEPVILDAAVRTGGDYGVTVNVANITETAEFLSSEVTFWGVPGDARHDGQRGTGCLDDAFAQATGGVVAEEEPCSALREVHPAPFLALPTSCPRSGAGELEPMRTLVEGDSWAAPGKPAQTIEPLAATTPLPALDGCNRLQFGPSIKVTPDSSEASKPTGLDVDVHVNQESVLNGAGLAESNVKDITVALPKGVAINPAGGDGLEACSSNPGVQPQTPGNQIGFEGLGESPLEPGVSNPLFTPALPGSLAALATGETGSLQPGINFCANASKIGEVTIHSPLLPNPLKGFVYLAAQEANPFGSLVAMYVVAEDPVSGTLVKLPGVVHLTPTGQIVSTFADNPQLPFEDAELHFFGGERAPLASPAHCGTYTTQASFAPWSGNETVQASSNFEVKSGPNGSACPGAGLPFSPSLTAGMTNINAGSFSPFTMTMSRASGQQNLQSVELKLPEGLSGVLSGTELCPEPQASQGLCGANSLIGETTVGVGVGGDPFSVKGGKVYLTGPYEGAPFGLSIVNPAKAGPYDLANTKANRPPCDCVLVRAKIEVNPITAALTVTSDNSGPYKIPTSIEGIPLQIQHVNVTISRPGFQFNPTNCDKMAIAGNLSAAEGATQALSVPFQVTNCAALKFAPKFAVSTSSKTSKANGASLHVALTYPKAPWGTQANIAKVKVELPEQLPSRLTTLQKACTDVQFKANPAGCPAPSVIGHARAVVPNIPVPLEGPAYFVSHGGEAFPSLIMVLQGYGVTVDLVGTTFISKAGVTSTTFKTVPDAPVGSFELTLPTGKYSALTALGNVCAEKLTMPSDFVGQNGMEVDYKTPVNVTGCAKTKALTRAQKLAKALKACKRDKGKAKREKCEKAARKAYGPAVKRKAKKKSGR